MSCKLPLAETIYVKCKILFVGKKNKKKKPTTYNRQYVAGRISQESGKG